MSKADDLQELTDARELSGRAPWTIAHAEFTSKIESRDR
jgi:hypothetical protein